jgi:hypothetical protein
MNSAALPVTNEAKKADAPVASSPGEEQQKADKHNSASSELSDLSSLRTSEDVDQAFDSMDEDESGTASSDESEDNNDTPKRSEKGTSREERLKFRDFLNKKLEDMFSRYRIWRNPTKADRFNSQS